MRTLLLRNAVEVAIMVFAVAACRQSEDSDRKYFNWSLGRVDDVRSRAQSLGCMPRPSPLSGEGAFECEVHLDECACKVSLLTTAAPRRNHDRLFATSMQINTEGCPDQRGVEFALALVEPAIASGADQLALRALVSVHDQDVDRTFVRHTRTVGEIGVSVEFGAGSRWVNRKIVLKASGVREATFARKETPAAPICDRDH